MIDFYTLTSPNVQKIYLMLEETKLAYKEHFVDVWKNEQYEANFLKINPNSKTPAIVDHDGPEGEPYTVFESGAILIYLADKTAMFLPNDTKRKYDTLQWLMFQVGGVGPMFGQLAHFALFAPKDVDNAYAFARYRTEVKRLYEVMEKRLARTPYLAGEDYTVADIATFPWTRLHDSQGVKWEDNPNLARWYTAINARPAVQAALSKVAAVKSSREIASPDQRDRLFNRGQYARI